MRSWRHAARRMSLLARVTRARVEAIDRGRERTRTSVVRYDEPIVEPRPIQPIQPSFQSCTATPNASAVALQIATANHTSFAHDLCASADRAIAKHLNLPPFAQGAFQLDVSLDRLSFARAGQMLTVTCKTSIKISAYQRVRGVVNGGAKVSGQANRRDAESGAVDCVDATIDDLVTRLAPQLPTYAPGTNQQAPTPTAPTPTAPSQGARTAPP